MITRRNTIVLAAASILSLATTGCSDDFGLWHGSKSREINLSADITEPTLTRASGTESIRPNTTVWVWADEIDPTSKEVTTADAIASWRLTANGSGALVPVSEDKRQFPDENYLNFYGLVGNFTETFTKNETAFPTEALTHSISTDQTTTSGESDLLFGSLYHVAPETYDVTLHFYHMLSQVKVALVAGGDITKAELADATVEIVDMPTSVTITPQKLSSTDMSDISKRGELIAAGTETANIKIATKANAYGESYEYASAIVAPKTVDGQFIKVTYDGTDYYYETTKNITCGKSYRYVLMLKDRALICLEDTEVEGYTAGGDLFYIPDPLTIEAVEAGTITIDNPLELTFEYRKNKGEWVMSKDNPITIDVAANDAVQFRGDNESGLARPIYVSYIDVNNDSSKEGKYYAEVNGENIYFNNFLMKQDYDSESVVFVAIINTNLQCSAKSYVYGSIMSLVSKEFYATAEPRAAEEFAALFAGNTNIDVHPEKDITFPKTLREGCFALMFADCTSLTKAPLLPNENLSEDCYYGMFQGCTALTTTPKLPALTLSKSCYANMFQGCTSLTTVSEISAKTLANDCCFYMFDGCTALTTAPELPATTLANGCYTYMFNGCTALTKAPELPATTLAYGCYAYMFMECTALTTAPKLPATTLANYCYLFMFGKCTALTDGPSTLPATTLSESCYNSMFYGCSKLVNIPDELPAEVIATSAYDGMFNGCKALKKAPKIKIKDGKGINSGCVSMFENCTSLTDVPDLDFTTNTCSLKSMFKGCTSLGKAPALPSTNLSTGCYNGMFSGCTSLTEAPVLPATTIPQTAYSEMFISCTALENAPALPATELADKTELVSRYYDGRNYANMFAGCTSLKEAPDLPATKLSSYCYSGMFKGCTALETVRELPATEVKEGCYSQMFYNCIDLKTTPDILPATTLAAKCYYEMFYNCISMETAPILPATVLQSECYIRMFFCCTKLNYVKAMIETYTNNNTTDWLVGVASSGTFVKKSNCETWPSGASGIPYGWTIDNATE